MSTSKVDTHSLLDKEYYSKLECSNLLNNNVFYNSNALSESYNMKVLEVN